jgi:hypothetical protein
MLGNENITNREKAGCGVTHLNYINNLKRLKYIILYYIMFYRFINRMKNINSIKVRNNSSSINKSDLIIEELKQINYSLSIVTIAVSINTIATALLR